MADISRQGTVIHAHKRYNAFEELFVALHRALPVRSTPAIYLFWCAKELFLALFRRDGGRLYETLTVRSR
jgi:hypothetical protein